MPTEEALLELLKRQKQRIKQRQPLEKIAKKVGCSLSMLKNALSSKLTLRLQLQRLRAKEGVQKASGGKNPKKLNAAAAWRDLPVEQRSAISVRTARRVTEPKRRSVARRKLAKKRSNRLTPGTAEYAAASRIRPEYDASQKYWS